MKHYLPLHSGWHAAWIVLLLSVLAAPAIVVRPHRHMLPLASPPPVLVSPPFQTGIASWYGKHFQGEQTTSGQRFNMYALTAAHRTLPLGSWIRVTNLLNHSSVELRVNDRGPEPEGRILDISYAAARALHFSAAGTAPVRIDLLAHGPHSMPKSVPAPLQLAER